MDLEWSVSPVEEYCCAHSCLNRTCMLDGQWSEGTLTFELITMTSGECSYSILTTGKFIVISLLSNLATCHDRTIREHVPTL